MKRKFPATEVYTPKLKRMAKHDPERWKKVNTLYKEHQLLDEKGNQSGFESEVFCKDENGDLMLYGTGQAASKAESRARACKVIVDDLIEIFEEVEAKKEQDRIEALDFIASVFNLTKLEHNLKEESLNWTTAMNVFSSKMFKGVPLVKQSRQTGDFLCDVRLPSDYKPLTDCVGSGRAKNEKDALLRASESLFRKMKGPLLEYLAFKNDQDIELAEALEDNKKMYFAIFGTEKTKNLNSETVKVDPVKPDPLKNEKPVINGLSRFENASIGLPERGVQGEKNFVTIMRERIIRVYRGEPKESCVSLMDKKYEFTYRFTGVDPSDGVRPVSFSATGVASTKKSARDEAARIMLTKLPRFNVDNPVSDRDRDACYRFVLDHYFKKLSEDHQGECRNRYLSYGLAQQLYLRTWRREDLDHDDVINPMLPGFVEESEESYDPGLHTTGRKGIFIPAYNPWGEITGAQLKPDLIKEREKYIWLSSTEQGGYPIFLPNRDVPLFCFNQDEIFNHTNSQDLWYQNIQDICLGHGRPGFWNPDVLGLCEGCLKPLVAAYRLRIPFIGAAGGDFISSGRTFLTYLKRIRPRSIIIFPDAGSVGNPQILTCYFKCIILLLNQGYKLKVAWWGQNDKLMDNDVDELEERDVKNFRLLDPSQFYEKIWTDCRTYVDNRVRNISSLEKLEQMEGLFDTQALIYIDPEDEDK